MDSFARFLLGCFSISFLLGSSLCETIGIVNDISKEIENKGVDTNARSSKVNLTVFYESLCPDSIDFFNHQLRIKYPELSNHVKLELVPYGLAKQTFRRGHWNFTCQHGPKECEYNKLHACAIKELKNDVNKSFKLVSCLMKNRNESTRLHKCASHSGVNLQKINRCRRSHLGDNLLAGLGNRTHSFRPKITWVPSVAFNNKYSRKNQEDSMKDLAKVICRHLNHKVKACRKYHH